MKKFNKNSSIIALAIISLLSLISCGKSKVETLSEEFCKGLDTITLMSQIDYVDLNFKSTEIIATIRNFNEQEMSEFEKNAQTCIFLAKARIGLNEGKRFAGIDFEMLEKATDSIQFYKYLAALQEINKVVRYEWFQNPQFKLSYRAAFDSLIKTGTKYPITTPIEF